MDTPSLLAAQCEGEPVEAEVPLGGDDLLVVTPTRTLVYRAEGLLRDEAVETIPHGVDRVELTEGRRKTTVTTSSLAGEEEFTLPTKRLDDVLAPLMSGVLRAADATADDEAVLAVYRFSELTLVVTEGRVVKHVGTALWDAEYESYPFSAVTDLDVEEGSVATQLVLTVDGRPQRIKTPNEQAGAVRRTLETALCNYHGVDSVVALRTRTAEKEEGGDADADAEGTAAPGANAERDAGRTVEPLLTDESEDPEPATRRRTDDVALDATPATGNGVEETTVHDDEVLQRLETLEATVDHQTELIERQQETLELLIEELRQGR